MLGIPRRHAHFLFAVMQSAITSAIAAAVASAGSSGGMFFRHWLHASLLAWLLMLPVVILFAPFLSKLSDLLTQPEQPKANAG
jgi:uncharacterized protein DUF2798